jgi:hemerythrin-like domain-containing protein
MDVLKLLKDDHDAIKHLFKQLEEADGARARGLFDEINAKLQLHEELEETLFYPALKQDEAARDIVLEGYQEHHVVDVLLEEISQLAPTDEAWQPKVAVLKENTEHHIEEEEGELFPSVRKIWNTETRERVGHQMQQMRNQRRKERRAA